MKLSLQKRLASHLLKASKKRVRFDKDSVDDIKEAITKADIRGLINDRVIIKVQPKGVARHQEKRKGKGAGSRKGKVNARLSKKRVWINTVRKQRLFLKELKDKGHIAAKDYRDLYMKSKGGFFRSKRHIKIYCEDNELFIKKK
ncbi:MAG: 50S ribosomal protein L19e [DPANN group archaeon]|nr:50S ribosomal protein L19e [DPANN group archaeon]